MNFSKILSQTIKSARLTPPEICAAIGVTRQTVWDWSSGNRLPSVATQLGTIQALQALVAQRSTDVDSALLTLSAFHPQPQAS